MGHRATKEAPVTFTASRLLVVIALILFVLAAFSVSLGAVNLLALGLAFFAASFLVP
jgi:hypothetical protein